MTGSTWPPPTLGCGHDRSWLRERPGKRPRCGKCDTARRTAQKRAARKAAQDRQEGS